MNNKEFRKFSKNKIQEILNDKDLAISEMKILETIMGKNSYPTLMIKRMEIDKKSFIIGLLATQDQKIIERTIEFLNQIDKLFGDFIQDIKKEE